MKTAAQELKRPSLGGRKQNVVRDAERGKLEMKLTPSTNLWPCGGQPSEMKGSRMKRHKLVAILLLICLALPASASSWLLESADAPDAPTEAEVDALEVRARAGDWELKQEFAAAYLYGNDVFYDVFYGCTRLKYGHRCRAMAKRTPTGKEFLRAIVETPPNDENRSAIRIFQSDYADSLLRAIRPHYDTNREVCREIVRYKELALKNGEGCVVRSLDTMARSGICMEKSEERAKAYRAMTPPNTACPTP